MSNKLKIKNLKIRLGKIKSLVCPIYPILYCSNHQSEREISKLVVNERLKNPQINGPMVLIPYEEEQCPVCNV